MILVQCASEAAPGGGPSDKTPPELLMSSIQSGATLVPADHSVRFVFSENLNTDIAEKSITVFPLSENTSSVLVKGKTITISPLTGWDPAVVYTIILGKNIADYRGNGLPQSMQFSFTAGENMPQNRLAGKINGLKSGTTAVISISRKSTNPDSILLNPEYYSQSGPAGDFVFEHLPMETFYVAAYIDLDKSNNYKENFDGVCVPAMPYVVPDTTDKQLIFEAVYDNFLPGRLLQAESLQPTKSKLTFQKEIATWNKKENYLINSLNPDSIIYNANTCTLYHGEIQQDTFRVELTSLFDHIAVPFADTSLNIPLTVWPDSFYHFTTLGNDLYISPTPSAAILEGVFQTSKDTSNLVLHKNIPGFYTLPSGKTAQRGTWLIRIPLESDSTWVMWDSLYSVPLELKPEEDYGTVIGKFDGTIPNGLRLQLYNIQQYYDIAINGPKISFDKIRPGSYALSYYIDKNLNGRRDIGRPFPYLGPEILYDLDTGIDVRARWDTELSEPYKIVIENEK